MRINSIIKLKKICAVVVASSFLLSIVNNVSYASINVDTIQSQKNIFEIKNTEQLNNLFSDKYGKLISFNNNASDTVVINIQDLHCDYSIQKNISSLIDEFSNKYKVENVFVEGGIGNIDTSFLSNIDSKYKQTVLENLLRKGRLTGTEYYSAKNNKTNLLKGLEDKDLYLQNISRLSDIIKSKEKTSVYLSKIQKEIDFLKSKYLNSKNEQFSKFIEKKDKGIINQEEFLKGLFKYAKENNININHYENLQAYLNIYDKNLINRNKLKKEFVEVAENIKKTVPYAQYQQFIKNTSNLTDVKNLEICINNYCLAKNINLENEYPNISKFFKIKKESAKCNPIAIVKEERKLVDIIRTELSENITELEVAYLSDFENFYKNYLTASLTADQWEYVKIGLDKFKDLYAKYSIENDVKVLDVYSKELTAFYDTNNLRNEIFIKNMQLSSSKINDINKDDDVSHVLSKAKNIVVLVAGGYHTEEINEILNKNNITNITITPKITTATNESRINYEYLAQKQAMSIKQMIALGLISNATQKEQIVAIIGSLLSNQNLDGTNINILVEQLNQIFEQNIKVSISENKEQLEFLFRDGKKEFVDINEDIAEIVEGQNKTDLNSNPLIKVEGENLKNITELVSKTTFNFGQEIFAPQIYQISKEVCIFMVNNKWYLGNGAIWDIANSEYKGQTLDGVEPIVYEYMPDVMQKGLLETQLKKNSSKKSLSWKKIVSSIKRVMVFVCMISIILTTTACSNPEEPIVQPYQIQEIELTNEQELFNEEVMKYADSFYIGNGDYKSFLYEKMPETYQNDTVYKNTVKNLENLYDQALVAMSYLQMGDIEKAERILSSIDAQEYLNKSNLENTQSTGEIVWVGIAAVQYKLLTGSDKFDGLIEKIDKHLNRVHKNDGAYYGEPVYSWVSTEHMLDIVAYFNLKTLYDDSEELKTKLQIASDYLYTSLYNETKGTFRRGLNDEHYVLDTCSWGTQVLLALKEINPEIYENSLVSNINIENLMEYAEENYSTTIKFGDKEYEHLYKWSSEISSPVSFEWSMEVAVAYNMLADYYSDKDMDILANEYREKANAILKDVQEYSETLGIEKGYITYSNKNEVRNYFGSSEGGWLVYVVPAVCTTVGQRVQIEYGSFFKPLSKVSDFSYVVAEKNYESIGFVKMEGDNWKTYSTKETLDLSDAKTVTIKLNLVNNVQDAKVKIQFLPVDPNAIQNLEGTGFGLYNKDFYFDTDGNLLIKINMEDFENETFGTTSQLTLSQMLMDLEHVKIIISAGETCFGSELNSTKLDVDIESINIEYNNSENIIYKQLSSIDKDPTETPIPQPTPASKDYVSSILSETKEKINDLIIKGLMTNKEMLSVILKEETLYSYFVPKDFVWDHFSDTQGAHTITVITDVAKLVTICFIAAFCLISFVDLTIKIVFAPMMFIIIPLIVNMTAHSIMDFRYLKSIGIEEAIALYGNENVSLAQKGTKIKNKEQIIPIYVMNDKPRNDKDFKMKSVPIKIKSENGNFVKCWLGNYKGNSIVFADGAKYETIVKEFSKTKQFETFFGNKTSLKANVDVIEVDLNNPNAGVSYSDNGNVMVGANIVKTGENIDIQKEIALLKNKKVEAVTINQNIAVYIDEALETISSSQDFVNAIDLYVKNNNLGTDSKILFSDKYIDKVLDLLEKELGNRELAQQNFIEMVQNLREENKEIIVIFDEAKQDYIQYQKYGISSYIANNEYVDGLTLSRTPTKFVTNLSQIMSFDGSLSIIKVSLFRKEIEKASGIFTFLTTSLNLKEYMKNRSVNFIKQVASNYDYDQVPLIKVDDVAKIINGENKFEELSKYLKETDSIYMYYLGLSTNEEKNAFVDAILSRALVVNYLKDYDKDLGSCYGLKNKVLEDILAKALIAKYNKDGNFKIDSQILLNENLTAAQLEIEFNNIISERVKSAFKDINVSNEINDPQSIDDIIKLIPLYADRNAELRTADIKVMDLQDIKGILSAA